MDQNTIIMMLGLAINFLTMILGGFKILHLILQTHIQNEHRLATIEEQVIQLMRHQNMKVRAG